MASLTPIRAALLAISLVVAAMIVRVAFLPAYNDQTAIARPFNSAFALTDQNGHPFTSAHLQNRPHALFFGYTSCPDICPTTLASLARWIEEARTSHVLYVFVTVDPEHDTSSVLKKYLGSFSPQFIGLTGAPGKVSEMLEAYHIFRVKVSEPDGSYTINHTASIFLVDSRGNLEDTLSSEEKDVSAVAKLKQLDKE